MSWDFILTAFLVCLSPGIGVVFTLSATIGGGFSAGFWAAIGCTVATVFHLIVAIAGLAAVLHTSALLFQAIKIAGVAYLLWMAWAVLRESGSLSLHRAAPMPPARLVLQGILLNLLNPKLPLFFIAFLPQFLPPEVPTRQLVGLGLTFTLITFATFILYAGMAATGRQHLLASSSAMAWMRRAFAASFALLGLKLATEKL